MKHKEYRKMLGKKCKDLTKEERQTYERLRYEDRGGATMRRYRRSEGKDVNAWSKNEYNTYASVHNSKMRKRWQEARDSSLTTKELAKWLSEQSRECYLCGCEYVGIDHIVPISRGGAHSTSNMAVCCVSCNSIKRDNTPEELLATLPSRRDGLKARIAEIEQDIRRLHVMEERLAAFLSY